MKRLLCVLMVLLVLSGCAGKKTTKLESKYQGATYVELMKNYQAHEKSPTNNNADNKEFDEFLTRLFVESMESDFLNMHYSIIDYKSYGIEKPELSFGEISYGLDKEAIDGLLDELAELQSFDYDSLSTRQQYDYEALEYSYYEDLASLCFYKYGFIFDGATDILSNIITNYTEYTFYDEESADDFIVLLYDVDRYLDDCLAYTAAQSKDGVNMIDLSIDNAQDYIEGFVSKVEDNAMISEIEYNLSRCNTISEEKKAEVLEATKDAVINEIIPAYKKVADELEQYRGKVKDIRDALLCNVDKDYAEYVYMLSSSSNEGVDEIFLKTSDAFDLMIAKFYTAIYEFDEKEFEEIDKCSTEFIISEDLTKTLNYLQENLTEKYPYCGKIEFTASPLDPSSASDSVMAYYMQAPIDNDSQNIIRTNPNILSSLKDEGTTYELYSTLAHEGFPGHCYQHVFYSRTNPHELRDCISFIGYTEGWAVQAQLDALSFEGVMSQMTADYIGFLDAYYFQLYSLLDMGYNYFGWTVEEAADFINDLAIFTGDATDMAEAFEEFLIDMPGTYCHYGVGYSYFSNFREKTMDELGDKFDLVSYNQALLENGPLPFQILETSVDRYVAENR